MNCNEAQAHIDEQASGAAQIDDPRVVRHLESCSSCRQYAARQARLDELVRQLPVPRARPGAREAAAEQVVQAIRLAARRRPLWIGAVASVAAAVAAGIWWVGGGLLAPAAPARPQRAKSPLVAPSPGASPVHETVATNLAPSARREAAPPTEPRTRPWQLSLPPPAPPAPPAEDLDLLERLVTLTLAVSNAETDAERLPLYHKLAAEVLVRFAEQANDTELADQYARILIEISPIAARLGDEGRIDGLAKLLAEARRFENRLVTAMDRGNKRAIQSALDATRAYRNALERAQG